MVMLTVEASAVLAVAPLLAGFRTAASSLPLFGPSLERFAPFSTLRLVGLEAT